MVDVSSFISTGPTATPTDFICSSVNAAMVAGASSFLQLASVRSFPEFFQRPFLLRPPFSTAYNKERNKSKGYDIIFEFHMQIFIFIRSYDTAAFIG